MARICDYKIVTATREKLLTEEFWFSRVTATAVMEILYLLLRAGMKGPWSIYGVMKSHIAG